MTADEPSRRSDGSLLTIYRAGDQSGANQLYEKYAERLAGLARGRLSRSLHARIDPEDIVQSVFRRFFASVDRGNYDVPRGTDLWSLLMVIALNRLRGEETRQRVLARDARRTVSLSETAEVTSNGLCGPLESELSQLMLREVVESLPELQRTAVELRMANFEVAEIALRIERSKRTTERLLQSAKNSLLRLLDGDVPESTA